MSKVLSAQILERLLAHPSLAGNLAFYKVQRFFELTTRLWLEIVPPSTARPDFLPDNIANLLSIVLQLEPEIVQLIWTAFSDLAEAAYLDPVRSSVDDDLKQHGHAHKVGMQNRLDLHSHPN